MLNLACRAAGEWLSGFGASAVHDVDFGMSGLLPTE